MHFSKWPLNGTLRINKLPSVSQMAAHPNDSKRSEQIARLAGQALAGRKSIF